MTQSEIAAGIPKLSLNKLGYKWQAVIHVNLSDSLTVVCALEEIRVGKSLNNTKTQFVVLIDNLLKLLNRLGNMCRVQGSFCAYILPVC